MARRKKQLIPLDLSNPMIARDEIIDDLLRKFPLGPDKNLDRCDYRTAWDGHPVVNQEQEDENQSSECGYPDLVLYRLGIADWGIRDYIRQRWPELKAAGVTRRFNRLNKRIGRAVGRVKRAGLPGLWEVSFGWQAHARPVVYAQNRQHAISQAEMFFSPAFDSNQTPNACFVSEGNPLSVNRANKDGIKEIKRMKKKLKESIEKAQKELARIEFLESTHEIYSVQSISETV